MVSGGEEMAEDAGDMMEEERKEEDSEEDTRQIEPTVRIEEEDEDDDNMEEGSTGGIDRNGATGSSSGPSASYEPTQIVNDESSDEEADTPSKHTANNTSAAPVGDDDDELKRMEEELGDDDAAAESVQEPRSKLSSMEEDEELDAMERQLREFDEEEKQMTQMTEKDSNTRSDEDTSTAVKQQQASPAGQGGEEAAHIQTSNPTDDIALVAHSPGKGALVIVPGSKEIITGGNDGMIKVLSPLVDPSKFRKELEHDSEVTCLAVHPMKEKVAVGDASGTVKVLRLPDGDSDDLICRLPGPARALAFSPDGNFIAIGTSEHVIKLIELENITNVTELKGHRAAILSVAFHPTNSSLLATSSKDGTVKLWSKTTCEHTISDILTEDRSDLLEAPQVGQLAWSPDGSKLAIPGKAHVTLFKNGDWEVSYGKLAGSSTKETNCVVWSPNSRYVAASSIDGTTVLWDVPSKHVVANAQVDLGLPSTFIPQALSWIPGTRDLALLSTEGDLHVLRSVVGEHLPSALADASGGQIDPEGANAESDEVMREELDMDDFDQEGDIDNDNDSNREGDEAKSNREQAMNKATEKQILERVEKLVEERIALKPIRQQAFQPGSTTAEDERRYLAWNSIGCILIRSEDSYNSVEIEFADSTKHRSLRFTDHYGFSLAAVSEVGAIFASEGSFQLEGEAVYDSEDREPWRPSPSNEATVDDVDWDPPQSESDLSKSRYQLDLERANGSALRAAMEAADRAEELGVAPPDMLGEGPAKPKSDTEIYGESSTVYYRPFNAWSDNAEWTYQLPAKEKARCVAAGVTFCAVATNRRTLRVFRPSGLQEIPLMLPGPVVAMAGASTLLMVAFHDAEPSGNKTQRIGYRLYDLGRERSEGGGIASLLSSGLLPLPFHDANPLKWVSFSDKSTGYMPVVLDSKGMLLGLSSALSWSWFPLLDTSMQDKEQRGTRLWPVSVQSNKLMAVLLKEGMYAPETFPRPVLHGADLQVPVLGLHAQTGSLKFKLEEEALRSSIVLKQLRWAQESGLLASDETKLAKQAAELDAKLVKAFVLSIRLKKPLRAFGLARRMRSAASLQVALVQAKRLEEADPALIERVTLLHQQRETEEEEDDADDDDDDDGVEEEEEEEEEEEASNETSDVEHSRSQLPKNSRAQNASGTVEEKPDIARVKSNRKRLTASRGGETETLADVEESPETENAVSFSNPFAVRNPKDVGKKRPNKGLLGALISTPGQTEVTSASSADPKRRKY